MGCSHSVDREYHPAPRPSLVISDPVPFSPSPIMLTPRAHFGELQEQRAERRNMRETIMQRRKRLAREAPCRPGNPSFEKSVESVVAKQQ